MLTIKFRFTANRYHATQWGRQVNEGVPEWPPSPWRILRGLVATWKRTLPELAPDRVVPILDALASGMPKYHLPPASTGHTRHYMPIIESGREKTTLVFDSFVAVKPNAPLFATWPEVELDPSQQADLNNILRNMPYLGRAESWVDAEIASNPPEENSFALEPRVLPEGKWDIVNALVPRHPIKLKDLMVEIDEMRGGGSMEPVGAQWWPYLRKRDCFTRFRDKPKDKEPEARGEGATVVRFALAGRVLPMALDTLRWGELARWSAMSMYGRQNKKGKSATLSGRDGESGNPLEGHRHAFYLPTDEDGDGRLDHLTVWAPGRLDASEFRAVVSVDALNPRRGREPLQLVYQGHGRAEDFVGVSPLFCRSNRWRSLTPYVLPRHVKFRGPRDGNGSKRMVDSPQEQIKREASLRFSQGQSRISAQFEKDPRIKIPPITGASNGFRPFDFHTHKKSGGGSSGGGVFNFTLEFDEEVSGPVVLGFGCHYGLGLFVPAGPA